MVHLFRVSMTAFFDFQLLLLSCSLRVGITKADRNDRDRFQIDSLRQDRKSVGNYPELIVPKTTLSTTALTND